MCVCRGGNKEGAGQDAQRIKALADKPNGLSSNPRTPVWKENPNSHKLSSDFHMYAVAFTHIHINKWQCVYYYYH